MFIIDKCLLSAMRSSLLLRPKTTLIQASRLSGSLRNNLASVDRQSLLERVYRVFQKSSPPPNTFWNIFTSVKSFCVKFC